MAVHARSRRKKAQPNLSNAQVLAIGRIITRWAFVEDLMGVAIGTLFCGNAGSLERYIVAAQMDYRHRRDAMMALCSALPDGHPAKTEFSEIMQEVERCAKLRHLAAHSIWKRGRKRGSIKPLSFQARGAVRYRGHDDNEPNYTAASLEAEAEAIGRLYGRLTAFLRSTGRAIWPGMDETIRAAPESDASSIEAAV